MQFCRFCGTKLPDDSLFCAACGRQLNVDANQPTNISAGLPPAPPHPLSTNTLSQPQQEPQNKRRDFALPIPLPPAAAPGNIPVAAGTPQIGTVPSVAGTAVKATAFTATTTFKIAAVALVCAALIIAGVKVIPPIIAHGGSTGVGGGPPKLVTVKMPPTQTSCPSLGQARASVVEPLALGKDQNIVYFESQPAPGPNDNYVDTGLFYRYDVITRRTTQIISMSNIHITQAQVSADEQWLLFAGTELTTNAAISQLRMIRLDGQGLQTLYCYKNEGAMTGIFNIQWSPDQKTVVFNEDSPQEQTLYLLNMGNGDFRELLPNTSNGNAHGLRNEFYLSSDLA